MSLLMINIYDKLTQKRNGTYFDNVNVKIYV